MANSVDPDQMPHSADLIWVYIVCACLLFVLRLGVITVKKDSLHSLNCQSDLKKRIFESKETSKV